MRGYIDDKTNRIIGWATIRQLRAKQNHCPDQRLIAECVPEYDILSQDKMNYEPGWIEAVAVKNTSATARAFQYRTSDELDSYPYIGQHNTYGGGGYVYELRGSLTDIRRNISVLKSFNWINNRTRAIFIQMSLYNPNVELYTAVTFLLEILPFGGLYPSLRVEPIQLDSNE